MSKPCVYSNEEIKDKIRDFYNINNRLPTKYEYGKENDMPAKSYVFKLFGNNIGIAKACEIELSEEEIKHCTINIRTNQEILDLVKEYTCEFIKSKPHLPRKDDLNNIIPSAVLDRRFKTMSNLYNKIGIDYNAMNEELLQQDMINKYIKLHTVLGHTPNSREIDKYAKDGVCYAMKTYSEHFGSLYELQLYCNMLPTKMGMNRNENEMMDDLIKLICDINRIPTSNDIDLCKYCCCYYQYIKVFGSLTNALLKLGYNKKDINQKFYFTKKGVRCDSAYEHKFASMLEKYNIPYNKDTLYKSVIKGFDRKYKFDFDININNKAYYIEIFGIEGNNNYNQRKYEKINICKANNIKLIKLYKEDILLGGYDILYELLHNKINDIKQEVA